MRDSEGESEAAETRAKASCLLAALGAKSRARYAEHSAVKRMLAERNQGLAKFWMASNGKPANLDPQLAGKRVLVIDAEDNFTAMLGSQLRALGLSVSIRRFDECYQLAAHDLVVMGPGPGDPQDLGDARIAKLHATIRSLLTSHQPFLAVCLSHQILSHLFGLRLARRERPNQGVQRKIDLFGEAVRVGFYNTFSARCESDKIFPEGQPGGVLVSRDTETGEVHALRGDGFRSVQFHPESVLSLDGLDIVKRLVSEIFAERAHPVPSRAAA